MREALAWAATGRGEVHELFVTTVAATRNPDVVRAAVDAGVRVSGVTDKAAAALSETVTPQGVVAVCSPVDVPPAEALVPGVRLVAVLHGVADPGNAGTVVRVADAAGADAVVFAGDTVDPHNGKCVRASTGSVFHLPITRVRDAAEAFDGLRSAGLRLVAADGHAPEDLVTADLRGDLAAPTAWVFGSEAHGLPDDVVASLDASLKVPIYGGAESLNLATAAAVCLYASARAQRA
ncbi:TrmH family RNA methyltransferase [Saccharothrix longispora]|uniref:TrmH family RNA methyltransferase n=1 Tax=Saccharothrix longispora TaxID=33920 RepID=A0ABU1PYH2_9PSEU|nr:TrmH family RNA methyltransferase [Saccharothrix longispora]